MVRAILESRKTQTRRIMKRKFPFGEPEGSVTSLGGWPVHFPDGKWENEWCPYGQPGDQLWVRETWRPKTHSFPIGWPYEYRATAEDDGTPTDGPWKPSLFMPRAASRILLEITDIKAERLNDINRDDMIAEGIEPILIMPNNGFAVAAKREAERCRFRELWNSINGPGAWDKNPYVWAITFKQV